MESMYTFPEIIRHFSDGVFSVCRVWVESQDDTPFIVVQHDNFRVSHKKTITKKFKVKKFKSFDTSHSLFEYAVIDATLRWKRKINDGYERKTIDNEPRLIPVTRKYSRDSDINFPCYTQPILGGIRVSVTLEHRSITTYLANGTEVGVLDHCKNDFFGIFRPNTILEGEVFHPRLSYEAIRSRVLRDENKEIDLEFWVSDIKEIRTTFEYRWEKILNGFAGRKFQYVKIVPTSYAGNHEDIVSEHETNLSYGHRGTVIKTSLGCFEIK